MEVFIALPALGLQKNVGKNKNVRSSLDLGLLPEGHFLAPRIGRTVYFFDFSHFFIKNVFFEFIMFLEAWCSPGPRFGEASYVICL